MQETIPLDAGTVTTPVTLAMIHALIPLGLRAVEEALQALQADVVALAGMRDGREADPGGGADGDRSTRACAPRFSARCRSTASARGRTGTGCSWCSTGRRRTSDQTLRWCAAALWHVEAQFRRVKKYKHLPLLKQALINKLTTTTDAAA